MVRSVRRALLGIAAGAGMWLGTAQAAPPAATTRAPAGSVVLQAMIRESLKIHEVHAAGSVQGSAGTLNLSGDCAGLAGHTRKAVQYSSVNVFSWVRGFLRHAAITTTIDIHLISIQHGLASAQAWSRSPSTGNRWQVAGRAAAVAELYNGDICFPLFAKTTIRARHETWQNMGQDTVNGRSVWRLEAQATTKGVSTSVTDLYVDQSSHDLLRYDQADTPLKTHATARTSMVFSNFNQKVTIGPPKLGATRP